MKHILAAIALALPVAGPVAADPNPQLVASIENRLAYYDLKADVSQFATSTVAALHLTLVSSEGYFKTRQELLTILRKAKYK